MHFVFDLRAQRLQGPPHRHVEQPGLRVNHQRGNQIHAKSQRQRPGDRAEVDAVAGYHMHPGEQVGEGVVAVGPRRGDGLILGDPRGQSPADDAVEQQVGGMAQDARDHDTDGGAGDTQHGHRDGRPPLRRKQFHQANRRAAEVPRPHRRGSGGLPRRGGHRVPPTSASSDCDSANSR